MTHEIRRAQFGFKPFISRSLLASLLMLGGNAAIADDVHSFDIDGSNAATAIQAFAMQSGMQILASGHGLEGKQLNQVNGDLPTERALQQLLAGSGLRYRYVGERAVALVASDDTAVRVTPVRYTVVQQEPASTGGASSTGSATGGGALEEIIVTARKVQENLQDTPVAITVLAGDALEDHQVFETSRLTQVVPNLQFGNNAPLAGNNSSSQVFIRGIGQTDPTSTVDPGVGMYIDDVYMGSAIGGTMDLRDINSVQVLRGPQGTLFGRNTIGGAILLSTTDPGDQFGGTIRGGFGSRHLINGFAALNVPFSDSFRARFSAGLRKQDGYVTRTDGTDLGDTNNYTLTAKFVWKPTDKFTAKLLGDYTGANEHGTPMVFAAINESATFPRVASADAGCPGFNGNWTTLTSVPMIADDRCANDLQARGPYTNNGTAPLQSKLKNWGTSLNVVYDITDAVSLKSVSAYRKLWWTGARDADNTPLTILHTYYDSNGWQFSQEFQGILQTSSLTGVVGVYYFKQRTDDIATVELNSPAPGVQHDSDNNDVDNKSWAAFTQWTYKFNDRLGATVGARYTHDNKGSYPDQFDYSAPTVFQVPKQWYRDTFTAFTPSASVNYRWSPQAMTYLSYSAGFKGGGWNSHFNAVLTPEQQAALQEFKPEKARTYEAGVKLDLLSNSLRVNAAVFTSDYTDMQITYRGPAPSGVAPFITNAGKASIDGAELEVTWAPTQNWVWDASVGYLKATVDRLDPKPLAVIPPGLQAGNTLPFAPKWQAHIGASYTIHANTLSITPRLDASYQSKTYFDVIDTPEIAQLHSYTVLNASAVIKREDQNWRVTLGVNNATDKLYPIAGNSSLTTGSGYAEIAYSKPREYFATLSYDF